MDSRAPINGLFAAVATPVDVGGRVDLNAFDRIADFLLGAGVDGICVGGATSEYPHFEVAERKSLIKRAASRLNGDSALLVGIGAPSLRLVLDVGAAALDAGSRAVLLPMPMFFNYEQEDLHAFCATASRGLRAPCLLYDLPEFSNPLSSSTALSLLREEEFITGIKDSSGREGNLDTFAAARGKEPWTLLVGDDRLLLKGMQSGWNGGISGVAGFCPELLVALRRSFIEGNEPETTRLQALLDELITHIAPFPAPWGIRIGLETRGFPTGALPLPLTPTRRRQILEFRDWFLPWWAAFTGEGSGGS